MIARIWSAEATCQQAPAYAAHLRSHVLPQLKALDGYAGAMLLERAVADSVEILVITYWESLDAVRRFSGPDPERAVVADAAAAVLTGFAERVRHYDVVVNDAHAQGRSA
jgi:heme-degrading monooxygenase HmoA